MGWALAQKVPGCIPGYGTGTGRTTGSSAVGTSSDMASGGKIVFWGEEDRVGFSWRRGETRMQLRDHNRLGRQDILVLSCSGLYSIRSSCGEGEGMND